jgi:hypothetical protein
VLLFGLFCEERQLLGWLETSQYAQGLVEDILHHLPSLSISLSNSPGFICPSCLPSVLSSDHSQEVIDFVRERLNRPAPRPSNSDIMAELLDVCLETMAGPHSSIRIGTDNMSAILVIIKQQPTGESSRSRQNAEGGSKAGKEKGGGSSKRGPQDAQDAPVDKSVHKMQKKSTSD